MTAKHFLLSAGLALLAGAVPAQSTLTENYETRNWKDWFGPATILGYDGTQVHEGSTALHIEFDATGPGVLGALQTQEFLPEVGTGLATGFTAQVYVSARVGATGVPQLKLEVLNETAGTAAGADTVLALDAWTEVALPAGNMTDNYKEYRFVIGDNGSEGVFDIWVDNMQREGVLWDAMEPNRSSSVVPANIEGSSLGGATGAGATLTVAGPSPTQGGLLYAMEFSGDTNNDIEVQHFYTTPLDLSGFDEIAFDLFIPSGTALPTASAFFWDGAEGSFHGGPVIAANDAWERVTLNITGLSDPGVAIEPTSIDEMKIVAVGIGAAGRVYVDNTVYTNSVPEVLSIVRNEVTPTSASVVTFTVTFDEFVQGVDASDFILAPGAPTGAQVTGVDPSSGPARTYSVTVDTGTGDGVVGLDLADDDTIADGSGLVLGGTGVGNGDFAGETYTVDKTQPGLGSGGLAVGSSQPNPTSSLPVVFTVEFDEPVNGFDENAVDVSGSSAGGTLAVTVSSSRRADAGPYTIEVSGATSAGTIVVQLVDSLVTDEAGNVLNSAGASALVNYDPALAGIHDWMQFEN